MVLNWLEIPDIIFVIPIVKFLDCHHAKAFRVLLCRAAVSVRGRVPSSVATNLLLCELEGLVCEAI